MIPSEEALSIIACASVMNLGSGSLANVVFVLESNRKDFLR